MTTESRPPTYRDDQLAHCMKELRAAVKVAPRASQALDRVEQRLRYVLRTLEAWDRTHAERAETLLRLGNTAAASTAASMIFDAGLRIDLLGRARIGGDADAADRMAEAIELEREVLA